MKSRNKDLAGIVTVALETGMRKAEILGLTWDRVDLSRNVVRLEITKSGRRREVPLRDEVYRVLVDRKADNKTGRVWPDRNVRKAFESAVEVAQLDGFRFHDLRHTFASWFIMRGGSLQTLKEILGPRLPGDGPEVCTSRPGARARGDGADREAQREAGANGTHQAHRRQHVRAPTTGGRITARACSSVG